MANNYYQKWYDKMMADPIAKEKYLLRKRERSRMSYRKNKLNQADSGHNPKPS